MARNQKLTPLLAGRSIAHTKNAGNELHIGFDDGSTMVVKTAGNTNAAMTGKVKAVRQQETKFSLDFEDGRTLEVQTAEPTSSVMLRDKQGKMEYAD